MDSITLFQFHSEFNFILLVIVGIIIAIWWAKSKMSHLSKLLAASLFGFLGYFILYFLSKNNPIDFNYLFVITYILFSVFSEILFRPIILSLVTKNCNPKYLAILMSIVNLPALTLGILTSFLLSTSFFFKSPPFTTLKISSFIMLFCIILIIILKKLFQTKEEIDTLY